MDAWTAQSSQLMSVDLCWLADVVILSTSVLTLEVILNLPQPANEAVQAKCHLQNCNRAELAVYISEAKILTALTSHSFEIDEPRESEAMVGDGLGSPCWRSCARSLDGLWACCCADTFLPKRPSRSLARRYPCCTHSVTPGILGLPSLTGPYRYRS